MNLLYGWSLALRRDWSFLWDFPLVFNRYLFMNNFASVLMNGDTIPAMKSLLLLRILRANLYERSILRAFLCPNTLLRGHCWCSRFQGLSQFRLCHMPLHFIGSGLNLWLDISELYHSDWILTAASTARSLTLFHAVSGICASRLKRFFRGAF